MLDKTRDNLDAAGVSDQIRAVVADAGYSGVSNRLCKWSSRQDSCPERRPPLWETASWVGRR
jgi:hypothetical protein